MGDDTGAELKEEIKGLRKRLDNHVKSISQLTPEQSRQYAEWLEELVRFRKRASETDRAIDRQVAQADNEDLSTSVKGLRGFIGGGGNVCVLTPGSAQKYADWLDELIVLRGVVRNARKEEEEKRLTAKQEEYWRKMKEEVLADYKKSIEKTFGVHALGTDLHRPFGGVKVDMAIIDDQSKTVSHTNAICPKTTAADLGLDFALDRSCHILEGSVFLTYPKHHSFRLSWDHPYIPFDPKTGESPEIAPDFRVSQKLFSETTLGGKLFFLAEGYKRTIARRQKGDRDPNGMRHEYDWYYYKHRFYPSGGILLVDQKWWRPL